MVLAAQRPQRTDYLWVLVSGFHDLLEKQTIDHAQQLHVVIVCGKQKSSLRDSILRHLRPLEVNNYCTTLQRQRGSCVLSLFYGLRPHVGARVAANQHRVVTDYVVPSLAQGFALFLSYVKPKDAACTGQAT